MNNFPKPHENLYDNKFIVPQINKVITSPIPVAPKVNSYPSSWDKPAKKIKLPPLNVVLSNHHYVIACVVFTSIVCLIAMIKAILMIIVVR